MKGPVCTYREGDGPLRRLSPLTKLIIFLTLLTSSLIARTPLSFLILITLIVLIARAEKLPLRDLCSAVLALKYFFIFIFLLNALLSGEGGEPFFSWHFISLSKESIASALEILLHVTLAVLTSGLYTMTSTPLEITEALRVLFKPLSYLHIPTEEAARILSLSLQLIAILTEEANMIVKAQCARGASLESGSVKEKAMDILPLVIPIFTAAFRRGDELATAMEARGYRGEGGARRNRNHRYTKADALAIPAALLFLILMIIIRRFAL